MKKVLITLVFFTLLSCKIDNKKILTVQPESEFPNFIFILVDDQGWNGTSVQMMANDSLSKSGYYQTPNLENILENYLVSVRAPKWDQGINWKEKPLKEFNSSY